MCAGRRVRACAPVGVCRHAPSSSVLDPPATSAAKEAVPSFLRAHRGPGSCQGKPGVLIPPLVRMQGWCRELPHVRASGLCRSCGGTLKKEAGSTGRGVDTGLGTGRL